MSQLAPQHSHIGFLGAGNMASALLRGLVQAGVDPGRLATFDVDRAKAEALKDDLGIIVSPTAEALCERSEVLVLAVKPQVAGKVLMPLASVLEDRLLVSVAAGLSTTKLASFVSPSTRVVRAMPNTPALVGRGVSAFSAGAGVSEGDLAMARMVLEACGEALLVDESMMDAVTGLSGSGPAYVMLVIEALSDGGVRAGLPRPIATKLATQTVLGSAALLAESGKHPGELKDAVTSPGGTTIAGVHALERGGLRAALIDAVVAATNRSKELSGS